MVESVPRLVCRHERLERRVEERQVPDQIDHLVADTLVGEAKRPFVHHAGFVEHEGVVEPGPPREPVGASRRLKDGPLVRDLRSEVNTELNFPPNFEGLVLGCIDADFCK